MAARITSLVKPELLVWARKSASMSIEQAAHAAGVSEEKLGNWEAGVDAPSIPQLKKLANIYKRPLSVLFLPEPPRDFMPLKDFRTLPGEEGRVLSSKLALEIRSAHERRQLAIDLYAEIDEAPPEFGVQAVPSEDPERVARLVRERLGVSLADQQRWRDPAKAFRNWRDAIEGAGVLVNALGGAHHQVPLSEMRGFAIAEFPAPLIVVNGQDSHNGRVFTLMHELAHVVLGISALENTYEPGVHLPKADRAIETFCNRVAAAVLMPMNAVLADGLVMRNKGIREWSDDDIQEIAARFAVSRDAILIRLTDLGCVSSAFVARKRRQYAALAEARDQDQSKAGGAPPYHYMVLSLVGRGYARLVMQAYYDQRLTLNGVSAYLNAKVKHVPKIEQAAFAGAA